MELSRLIFFGQMTDKERIRQLEKDLAICRKTVEKLSKENSALKLEVGVRNKEKEH